MVVTPLPRFTTSGLKRVALVLSAQGRPSREAGKKAAAAIAATSELAIAQQRRGAGRPVGSGWKQRALVAGGDSLLMLAAAAASGYGKWSERRGSGGGSGGGRGA
eukprot:707661-Prorocentrum_minimum.AAC.1